MSDMSRNVLIVDDNQYLREILATMLRFSGYEISQAANGSEALKKAVSVKPILFYWILIFPIWQVQR